MFNKIALAVSRAVGKPYAFVAAIVVIVGWLFTGPATHYSNTWQLVINTGTTIVTFLMVFLIQHTQNRDAEGVHLKLDELIRATKGARISMINLERLSDRQLQALEAEYNRLTTENELLRDRQQE